VTTSAPIAAGNRWVSWCAWLICAATIVVYVWKPDWPRVVRQLPFWPWFALFVAVASFVTMRVIKRPGATSIAFGAVLLILYFCIEQIGTTLVFEATRVRPRVPPLDPIAYLFAAFFNVICHRSVVLVFVVLHIVLLIAGTRPLSVQRMQS
jgi:hypothetical protein